MQEQDITMALLGQDRIAEKLESIKQVGHISEYLVTWRGSGGQLDPNVTSEYDLLSLVTNRTGPLPGDVPNSFKAD